MRNRHVTPVVDCIRLNQSELADRWRISPRTLERWRFMKVGPVF